MMNALLDDAKSPTRRIIKPQPDLIFHQMPYSKIIGIRAGRLNDCDISDAIAEGIDLSGLDALAGFKTLWSPSTMQELDRKSMGVGR